MEMLSSKQKIAIIIAGIIIVGIFIFYMSTKTKTYDYSALNEVVEEKEQEEEQPKETAKEIVIHITGAVKKEGIVVLEEGARIVDAIEEADGLTEEADLKNVNLAYQLNDGQKIYIPKILDTEEEIETNTKNEEVVIIDNGNSESTNTKININTAKIGELMTLSGIGESTARKIVEHRTINGKFKTIEAIKDVSGIGESKYEAIKNDICV